MRHKKTLLFLFGLALAGGAGFAVSSLPIEDGAVSNGQILYKPSRPAQSDVLERFALQRDPWQVYNSPTALQTGSDTSLSIPKSIVTEARAVPTVIDSFAKNLEQHINSAPTLLHKAAYPASVAIPASEAKPKQSSPKPIKFRRVAVIEGGTLRSQNTTVQIKDIRPLPLTATCRTKTGHSWPCGRHAQAALTRFIQNKSIACYEADLQGSDTIHAHCMAGPHDIATWLVQNGWARPDKAHNTRFVEMEKQARTKQWGMWRTRMVQLTEGETGRLISSFEELYNHQRSFLPLVVDGSPRIIWRRRAEPQLKTPPVPEPRS